MQRYRQRRGKGLDRVGRALKPRALISLRNGTAKDFATLFVKLTQRGCPTEWTYTTSKWTRVEHQYWGLPPGSHTTLVPPLRRRPVGLISVQRIHRNPEQLLRTSVRSSLIERSNTRTHALFNFATQFKFEQSSSMASENERLKAAEYRQSSAMLSVIVCPSSVQLTRQNRCERVQMPIKNMRVTPDGVVGKRRPSFIGWVYRSGARDWRNGSRAISQATMTNRISPNASPQRRGMPSFRSISSSRFNIIPFKFR